MSCSLSQPLRVITRSQISRLGGCAAWQRPIWSAIDTRYLRPSVSRRNLSTSPRWRAESDKPPAKKPTKNSWKIEQAKAQALREGNIPEDVGVLRDTFVMPYGKKLPSWISHPRDRYTLEMARFIAWFKSFSTRINYKWFFVKPRPQFHLRQIPKVAQDLHRQMSEHFATGDLEPIKSKLVQGFVTSLRGRVGQRPAGTHLKWTLHEYKSSPKLMSHMPAALPGGKTETAFERKAYIQAVVRIHSLQSLQRVKKVIDRKGSAEGVQKEVLVDSRGKEIADAEYTEENARKDAKELVEYVVIQKVVKNSKEGPWKLWGTTEETTVEKLAAKNKQAKKLKAKAKGDATEPITADV